MASIEKIDSKLREIIRHDSLMTEEDISSYSYDGITPDEGVIPSSIQELQRIVRYATENKLSIIPTGSGTKLGIGNLAEKTDLVVSTNRLNKVLEYEPADLTVTVEAGIRLTDLQTVLSEHNQFLPLDPPYGDRCTIGGIVSSNSSGPLRHQYGTARNLVLGLKVMNPTGTVVKSGGKVVKNVAGYDINKLYIGAFGTLGIITEVTLKLAPLPTKSAVMISQFENIQDAITSGLMVASSQIQPLYVNLCSRFTCQDITDSKPTLLIGFGGDPEAVSWQLDSTQTLMEQNSSLGVHTIDGESQTDVQKLIQEFAAVNPNSDTVLVKLNLKRTDIAEFAVKVLDITDDIMVIVSNGVLYLRINKISGYDVDSLSQTLNQLREDVVEAHGNLIIEDAPPELKQQIDVWGSIDRTILLMKQIKAKFDGGNILNPGRFVSAI
ncbi:FAD-binding oxidoreductase [Candidatus Poribacteria bacterium]|nr:FAD-binding oxidoreductase [Candidatus Poribacteria bacterium]